MGGYHTVVAGQTITAANHNTYIRDQSVNKFASSTTRDAAISVADEGMYADLADFDGLSRYDGTTWDLVPWSEVKKKNADQSVNNTTTFASDNTISWAVTANAQYTLRVFLLYNSGTTPDIKFQWSIPAGLTMTWVATGLDTSGTFVFGNILGESSQQALGGTAANVAAYLDGVVTVGGTGGNLTMQFAQQTANVSNTTVKAGTYGVLTRFI